jgi:hypothetical protein
VKNRSQIRRASGSTAWGEVLLGFALVVTSSPAAAEQNQPDAQKRSMYLELSVASATRPAGESDYHYTSPMLGGTTPDVVGTLGVFLTPRFSVAGEASFGSVSGVLVFDHFLYYRDVATYHETLVSVAGRLHLTAKRIRLEPMGALGIAAGSTSFTERSGQRPDESFGRMSIAVGTGLDVVVPFSRRVAVTGLARLYFVSRNEVSGDPDFTGISNHTLQFGAGMRWTLR